MEIKVFIILATIVMGFLALIWKHNTWGNVFIKFTLICMSVFGTAVFLKHFYL